MTSLHTDKETLERAIARAIEGGWKEPHGNTLRVDDDGRLFCFINGATDGIRAYGYQFNLERLIYSHEFAKALFAEADSKTMNPGWRFHIQQAVIAPNPIQYIATYLEESAQ
jgi:hypothetical protein